MLSKQLLITDAENSQIQLLIFKEVERLRALINHYPQAFTPFLEEQIVKRTHLENLLSKLQSIPYTTPTQNE